MSRKLFRFPLAAALGLTAVVPAANAALIVSEVDANGQSRPYADDWAELTNTGPDAIDLTNWKLDDSGGSGVPILGLGGLSLGLLAPGQSVIVLTEVEDAAKFATERNDFITYWFGAAGAPAGFLMGYAQASSGLGLTNNPGGDAIRLWNGAGVSQPGILWTIGADGQKTFDNTAGLTGEISAISQIGVNGAFQAANGVEIGSPGVSAVPLPAAAWLMLSGLGALGAAVRRRRNQPEQVALS